jgi:hypothetical protein
MTNATCGLRGFLSSASAALEQSLVSRLRRQLDGVGSTLFSLTWNRKATPAGRPYFQLAASAHRTSGNDCGSWPTTRSTDGDKNVRTAEGSLREIERKGCPQDLNQAAILASWPTPMAGTPAQKGYNEAGNTDSGRRTVDLVSWPTPTVHDAERGGQAKRAMAETRHGSNLQDFALLAAWATPAAQEAGGTAEQFLARKRRAVENGARLGISLTSLALQASGMIATGSPAPMGKRGQLNPAHSRWLMGYPAAWDDSAPTAIRSFRKSRPNSSKHT